MATAQRKMNFTFLVALIIKAPHYFPFYESRWLRTFHTESTTFSVMHIYAVRPRKDHRGVDLISDALPFGGLCYDGPNAASNAVDYAKHRSRAHRAVIRVHEPLAT